MAAAPRRRSGGLVHEPGAWRGPRRNPRRGPGRAARERQAGRRRRFALLVVVPVLLMLGSVYLHTVSAALGTRVAGLQERLSEAAAEAERLDVRAAKLSSAERVRPLAEEKLGMRDPGAKNLEVYASEGEDGEESGRAARGGEPR